MYPLLMSTLPNCMNDSLKASIKCHPCILYFGPLWCVCVHVFIAEFVCVFIAEFVRVFIAEFVCVFIAEFV